MLDPVESSANALHVIRIEHPRLAGTVAALGAGLLLLAMTPVVPVLEKLDRLVFEKLAGGAPEVEGRGTLEDPRKIAQYGPAPEAAPPTLMTLEEDPEGWFEAMPPPPSDMAVVLVRLHDAGVKHLGLGYPLQWEEPDVLAVQAMRGVMDRFDSLVLGFPVKDGTAGEPVAAPFLRASVDEAAVAGDVTELPVVNAIRGVAPELGGEKSLAGFTRLVSEKEETGRTYLLARWGDRVIFSLPLALEITRRGLAFEDVGIEVGKVIRLGDSGPRIPIDFRGRARLPEDSPGAEKIPLRAMIEGTLPEDFASKDRPVFIGDARLLGPKEDVAWTTSLAATDAVIRSAPVRISLKAVPRLDGILELVLLIFTAGGCGWVLGSGLLEIRVATSLVVAVVLATAALVAIRFGGVTLPLLALLSQPFAALLAGELGRLSTRVGVVDSAAAEREVQEKERAVQERRQADRKPRRRRRK